WSIDCHARVGSEWGAVRRWLHRAIETDRRVRSAAEATSVKSELGRRRANMLRRVVTRDSQHAVDPVSLGSGTAGRARRMAQIRSGIVFGPYRLDVGGARLWKGTAPVPLQPRPL